MANRKFIHIKKADIKPLEQKLLAVSGSFGLSGQVLENGDMILDISDNVPNYHLFEGLLKKEKKGEILERTAQRKTLDDVLQEKNLRKRVLTDTVLERATK